MRTGQGYTLAEFVLWTRRSIYGLLVLALIPALLHQFAGFTWLTVPWGVVFMLGTTVALSAGFRTLQTYNRLQEAQQAWSSIVSSSRVWGGLCRDLVDDPVRARARLPAFRMARGTQAPVARREGVGDDEQGLQHRIPPPVPHPGA